MLKLQPLVCPELASSWGPVPQTLRHREHPPTRRLPPGPRLPLGASRLPGGETQHVRYFVENMDFHRLCPGENPGEVKGWQRLRPSQSSWLHPQNRHGRFLQRVLLWRLAWPVHRAAHRQTHGRGARGETAPRWQRGWRQAGGTEGCHCLHGQPGAPFSHF